VSDTKKKVKLPSTSANSLTKHAMKVLTLKGFKVWRQNNAAVYDEKKKVYRANSSTPGISDILGFHLKTGQFLACEIKAGRDKLSTEQKIFLEEVAAAGGIALIIRSADDLENFIKGR
jgi:hypothetical protein